MNTLPKPSDPDILSAQGLRRHPVRTRDAIQQSADPAAQEDILAEEVPVALVYNGISHVVMMATPLDLQAFALGFPCPKALFRRPPTSTVWTWSRCVRGLKYR